jgi:hypothetical protein
MRDENEYDGHQDTLNRTFPFEKFGANVENRDVELNRKLMNWEWL